MGWDSNTYRYDIGSGVTDESKYYSGGVHNLTGCTWFFRNWWGLYRVCKIFTNDTAMPVKLKNLAFLACAGHSGGQPFKTSGGSGRYVYGAGCYFYVDIYAVDASGNLCGQLVGARVGQVNPITSTNSSCNGVPGAVSNSQNITKFGIHSSYTGDHSLYKERRVLDLSARTDVPVVPVGGKMFVHVYATNNPSDWWGGTAASTSSNSLLVVKFDGSATTSGGGDGGDSFQPEVVPEPTDYIWRMTETGWVKERMAHVMTNNGWELLKGN